MIMANGKVKYIWILTFLLIFQNSVESQIIDCSKLRKQSDIVTFNYEPFNGACQSYDSKYSVWCVLFDF